MARLGAAISQFCLLARVGAILPGSYLNRLCWLVGAPHVHRHRGEHRLRGTMSGASIRWFCLRVLPLLLATITAASGEANAVQIIYASSTFEGVVYRIDPSGAKSVFAA